MQKKDLSADGTTTGPSPYLIESTNGQYLDKDKPAPLDMNSDMGILRGYVTKLQDDINVYLTQKIKASGSEIDLPEEDDDDSNDNDQDDQQNE